MKAYIIAFLTLAAVAVAASDVGNDTDYISKEDFIRLIEKKLNKIGNRKRDNERRYTCDTKKCADSGDTCNGDLICKGFRGCVNGVCKYSKEGDFCYDDDDTCYSASLYCDVDRCRKYAKVGDMCVEDDDCYTVDDTLYCNVDKNVYRGVGSCRYIEKGIGDECEYERRYYCNSDISYCTATNVTLYGICKALPSKEGEDCSIEYGCNAYTNLYCSSDTNKCVHFPKEGENCINEKCSTGYYCNYNGDNKCYALKNKGEACTYSYECKDNYKCPDSKDKAVCTDESATLGEYCEESYPHCVFPYTCENNKCVDMGYDCNVDSDCPDFTYYCDNHTCKGGMMLGEGEKCIGTTYIFGIEGTLQCKPGYICVENSSSSDDYVCRKALTKKGDLNYCSSDSDCPYDATCECDDAIGKSVCVPLPPSSKKLKKLFKNYLEGDVDDMISLYKHLIKNYLYYDIDARCGSYVKYLKDAASTTKVSAVMIFFAALVSFLFF